ncbi:MAG TPA: hypothetical protein VG097_17735 [Gemmata sp.]|nr:hypothetical protein [Gemmata sp.]
MAAQQRFRVPNRNGEVLAVPGFEAIPKLIEENRRRLDRSDVKLWGQPLHRFRANARAEALALSQSPLKQVPGLPSEQLSLLVNDRLDSSPLIVSGHQPELSHPGVWIKNFVLNGLARRVGGIPLHLIVDNDTLKSTSLHFPVFQTNDARSVHQESLPFDVYKGEVAYEDRQVLDAGLFGTFPDRAKKLWQNWGYEPLLPRAWKNDRKIGNAFVAARLSCEREWGCQNFEVTVSRLSQTLTFGMFAQKILSDLPRFRKVYNAAIRSYRRANRIKSQSHPAPELSSEEAPFWERTGPNGQRKRANAASEIEKLRPRALTLTLFARLCLADFFIHGIGGGKYDEVTNIIIRDYFGIEPPAYQVLSATLLLPLPGFPGTVESVRRTQRYLRDLQWNPQFQIETERTDHSIAVQLIAEKERLIRSEPPSTDHTSRREWFRSLQHVTERLRPFVKEKIAGAEESLRLAQVELEGNRVLRRRDYAWMLYPETFLRPFLQQFLNLGE